MKLGPVAHQFGVVKGPAPLVNREIGQDEVQVINSNKCLLFLSTADLAWVDECANAVKGRLTTFLVNGADRMPASLTNYLFNTQLNDAVVITDLSIPKGYQ